MFTREQLQARARKEPGKLVDLVLALQKRVQELEGRLAKNSRNSSKTTIIRWLHQAGAKKRTPQDQP